MFFAFFCAVIVLPSIIDTYPGLVWVQDISGHLIWCNDTWHRYTGIGADLPSELYSDRVHPEDGDRLLLAVIQSARLRGWTTLRARMGDRNGAYRSFFIQLGYYQDADDGTPRWIGLATAIETFSGLRNPTASFGAELVTALEAAHIGVWSWDLITDEMQWSDCLFELLGLKKAFQRLTRSYFFSFVQKDDLPLLAREMNRAMVEVAPFQLEFRIRREDGEERWVYGAGQLTAEAGTGGLIMVGVLYDVNARVLRERNKDRFIGIASHELRTPITSIKAYSQLLRSQLAVRPDSDEAILLDRLVVQADRLSDLARILLDTTRIAERRLILDYGWFDLKQLVLQCIDVISASDKSKPIVYDQGITGSVFADEERVRQVCVNLMTNAMKFSALGSPVLVRTWREEGRAGVAVQDQGIGIPESMIDKIFEPYVQGGDVGQSRKSGLGLGLYISAGIIEQHGGRISLESKLGEGSTFWFTIPADGKES